MTEPELYIRHVLADAERAALLARALEAFGYETVLTSDPIRAGQPVIALWSPASLEDDSFVWECANAARNGTSESPAPIYQVLVAPAGARVSIHPYFTGRIAQDRWLGQVDLSTWSGDPGDDRLAPLIWELPPPRTPAPAPPIVLPQDRWQAEWRALRATGDVVAMADALRLRIAPNRSREGAAKFERELNEMRAIGANPDAWTRYGPRTATAAAAGAAALRSWADTIAEGYTVPDPQAPDRLRKIGAAANLLFAIQVCAGLNKSHAFSRDLRTREDIARLIEAGDRDAILMVRYDNLLKELAPTLERLAKENNPTALYALSLLPKTPDYRRRVLQEKAAQLGDATAIHELVRDLEFRGKRRDTIPLLRHGAELGDRHSKEQLARALDTGKHVRRDAGEAFALYTEIAASSEWPERQIALRIAQMKWDGDGCPRDRDGAVHAFFDLHIADEAPYAVAIHIGDLYRDGLGGMPKDRDEAVAWYKGAATYGDVEGAVAMDRLRELHVEVEERDLELDAEQRDQVRDFWRPRA